MVHRTSTQPNAGRSGRHLVVPPRAPKQAASAAEPSAPKASPMLFEGSLSVRWINGRNGEFAVGELLTSIGVFKVKDPLVEQFDEGTYSGRFWISSIYPGSYAAGGRVTVEVRATLVDLQIDEESDVPAEAPAPSEPDPIDETPQPAAHAAPATAKPKRAQQAKRNDDQADDESLFGDELFELVDQRLALKLDPTIGDRGRFRRQCDRLKVIGYSFESKTQQWLPPQ